MCSGSGRADAIIVEHEKAQERIGAAGISGKSSGSAFVASQTKPKMNLQAYQRQKLLGASDQVDDSPQPTHVQEEERLRQELLQAVKDEENDGSDEEILLTKRDQTVNETEQDIQDYRQLLLSTLPVSDTGDIRHAFNYDRSKETVDMVVSDEEASALMVTENRSEERKAARAARKKQAEEDFLMKSVHGHIMMNEAHSLPQLYSESWLGGT